MRADRRNFLLEAPATILGLGGFAEIAFAQASQNGAKVATDVVDFWVSSMGLSPDTVIGGERTRGRRPNGPAAGDVAREPLFLHYDPNGGGLVTADEVPINQLADTGDTDVQFQMVRMRLNGNDDKQFRSYASGGIYVDFQQAPQQSTPSVFDTFANAIFSSISASGGSGKGGGKDASSSKPEAPAKGKGKNNFLPSSAPGASTSVPLQGASQAQSISLPGGAGKHSFACFAKDKQKTLFGTFVGVFATLLNSPAATYLPMLSMPVIGPPALNAMRSLVANLQAHGGDQQWIMMSPPIDVVTTQESAKGNPSALRLRPGNYIMIPKEHASTIKGQLGDLKVLDGFLVPKNATPLDVYDAYPSTATGVSYISLSLGVQPAKSNSGRAAGKQTP